MGDWQVGGPAHQPPIVFVEGDNPLASRDGSRFPTKASESYHIANACSP